MFFRMLFFMVNELIWENTNCITPRWKFSKLCFYCLVVNLTISSPMGDLSNVPKVSPRWIKIGSPHPSRSTTGAEIPFSFYTVPLRCSLLKANSEASYSAKALDECYSARWTVGAILSFQEAFVRSCSPIIVGQSTQNSHVTPISLHVFLLNTVAGRLNW